MRFFVSPSPKANGPAGKFRPGKFLRPDASESREVEYSFFTSLPSFLRTASSQDISISRPLSQKASQTRGLNQCRQRAAKLTSRMMWSPRRMWVCSWRRMQVFSRSESPAGR